MSSSNHLCYHKNWVTFFFFSFKSCIWLISVWNAKEKHKLLGRFLAELLCETTAPATPALQILWSRCSLQRGFTEHGGFKGPLEVIWSNPVRAVTVSKSQLLRAVSWQLLKISKDADTTASLVAPLFVHTLTIKLFSCVQTEFHVSSEISLPLVLALGTSEKSLAPASLHPLFRSCLHQRAFKKYWDQYLIIQVYAH